MIDKLFLNIINMTVLSSYSILFVIIVRFFFKRAPKKYSFILWSIVFIRLVCPFSFENTFSFVPSFIEEVSDNITYNATTQLEDKISVSKGTTAANNAPSIGEISATKLTTDSQSGVFQNNVVFIASRIWLTGIILLLIYSLISSARLKYSLRKSFCFNGNLFKNQNIKTPFVFGIIKPKIYLPTELSEAESEYILAHERIHINRFDYLSKPIAYIILCIHWINPLVWLSYFLMSKDMEMSCDERVIEKLGSSIKREYSQSLLNIAIQKKGLLVTPIAFGENNAKSRIKNVLRYKRPTIWVSAVILLTIILVSVGLLSTPRIEGESSEKTEFAQIWAEALKTRNGEPRFKIMSEEMKVKFINNQKNISEPWNFIIGGSSPDIISYDISIEDNTAKIIYHMADNAGEKFEKTEIITFGKENNKLVVTDAREKFASWERVNYFAPTAKAAMEVYKKALLESDYPTILSLEHNTPFDENGEDIWHSIKIGDVRVISETIKSNSAVYKLELNIQNSGNSAFEKGVFPRWLLLEKDKTGWFATGLVSSEPEPQAATAK